MSYLGCSVRLYLQLFVGGLVLFRMFSSSLPPVVCRRVHALFTLFVFVSAQWCPTHIVQCPLFCLSLSCVMCTQYCQFLWIVHSLLPLRFSLMFINFEVCYITLSVQHYHLHYNGEMYQIKHCVIKFTNDLRQFGGFLPRCN